MVEEHSAFDVAHIRAITTDIIGKLSLLLNNISCVSPSNFLSLYKSILLMHKS